MRCFFLFTSSVHLFQTPTCTQNGCLTRQTGCHFRTGQHRATIDCSAHSYRMCLTKGGRWSSTIPWLQDSDFPWCQIQSSAHLQNVLSCTVILGICLPLHSVFAPSELTAYLPESKTSPVFRMPGDDAGQTRQLERLTSVGAAPESKSFLSSPSPCLLLTCFFVSSSPPPPPPLSLSLLPFLTHVRMPSQKKCNLGVYLEDRGYPSWIEQAELAQSFTAQAG